MTSARLLNPGVPDTYTRTEPKATRPDPTQDQKLLRVGEDLSKLWIKWDTAREAVNQSHMEAVEEQLTAKGEDDDECNAGWDTSSATPNDTPVMCDGYDIKFEEESDSENCG